jgi:hypothetical protein
MSGELAAESLAPGWGWLGDGARWGGRLMPRMTQIKATTASAVSMKAISAPMVAEMFIRVFWLGADFGNVCRS